MLPSLAWNISQTDANARMLADREFEGLRAMLADGINAASRRTSARSRWQLVDETTPLGGVRERGGCDVPSWPVASIFECPPAAALG